MTSEQAIEVGKALLPYLRNDLRPEELGMAAHDAAAALSRTGGRGELVKRAAMIERERCAQICDEYARAHTTTRKGEGASICASLIRDVR